MVKYEYNAMFNDSRFVRLYSGKLNIQNGGGAWLGSEVISIQNGGEGSIEYARC